MFLNCFTAFYEENCRNALEIGHVMLRKSKKTLRSVFHLFVSFASWTGIAYFRQNKLIIIKTCFGGVRFKSALSRPFSPPRGAARTSAKNSVSYVHRFVQAKLSLTHTAGWGRNVPKENEKKTNKSLSPPLASSSVRSSSLSREHWVR